MVVVVVCDWDGATGMAVIIVGQIGMHNLVRSRRG